MTDKDTTRRAQIEAVAMQMLAEKGYQGMSMLAVAKAAKASNGTLYRWYGSKPELFAAIVRRNAESAQIDTQGAPLEVLERLAPKLLAMLCSEGPVLLNRAAAAEPGGALAQALAEEGRGRVMPQIAAVMAQIDGVSEPEALADLYVSLVVGDWQIRRVSGGMAAPTPEDVAARCALALRAFRAVLDQSVTVTS